MAAVVVRIGKIGRHPFADDLCITCVNGRCTIFPTGDYWPGDKAVYVEKDTVVPTARPEFHWLSKKPFHKVRKAYIRGIPSYGFLIPYQDGDGDVGNDISADLDIFVPTKPKFSLWQRFKSWVTS